ncbi:MAG: hypothetical protein ISQ02_11900 [Pseudomonadales bacterium]|nr:hypothetical protein [Pseudomonadales bacterium]
MNHHAITFLLAALSVVSPVSGWAQASAQGFLVDGPRIGGPAEQELDLITLRDQGVRVVVDLRNPEGGTQGESEAAARLGFVYVNLPVRGAASSVVRNVGVLLDAYGPEQVYLHCKSGQRAAEVWGRHQLNRGVAPGEVIAGASAWGLSDKRVGYPRTHAGLPPAAPQAPSAPTAPSAPAAPKAP